MRKDLLERLATLLETDATNPTGIKFDMRIWAKKSGEDTVRNYYHDDVVQANCGTTGCAFGLAAISGAFKDDGLTYDIIGGRLTPTFDGRIEYDAAAALFELERHDAEKLFDPFFYEATQRVGAEAELEVARRIRELVTDGRITGYRY